MDEFDHGRQCGVADVRQDDGGGGGGDHAPECFRVGDGGARVHDMADAVARAQPEDGVAQPQDQAEHAQRHPCRPVAAQTTIAAAGHVVPGRSRCSMRGGRARSARLRAPVNPPLFLSRRTLPLPPQSANLGTPYAAPPFALCV